MTMPFRGKTKSSIGVPPVSSAKTGMSSGKSSKEVLSHGIDSMQPIAERICGRPYFVMDAEFTAPMVGNFDTQMVREFFYAISYSAAMNLHLKVLSGFNDHHKIEALFKAFSKALDQATGFDERITDVLSTKGAL